MLISSAEARIFKGHAKSQRGQGPCRCWEIFSGSRVRAPPIPSCGVCWVAMRLRRGVVHQKIRVRTLKAAHSDTNPCTASLFCRHHHF